MSDSVSGSYRKGRKSHLRLSTKRKKRYNFYTFKRPSNDNNNPVPLISNENDVFVQPEQTNEPPVTTKNSNVPFILEGRRIVDINYFISSILEMNLHNTDCGCTLQNMNTIKEERIGFRSIIYFRCNMCNKTFKIHTSADSNHDVNEDAVLGIASIGCGFSSLEQFSAALDVPCMSSKFYQKNHDKICTAWEDKAIECMKVAADEEKRLAIEAGHVNNQGVPMITVVADGSWAKRSYRSLYNSPSGAAAIVGFQTKKVLYIGVRNKFCTVCKMAEKGDNEVTRIHKCYKNWTGSSTSMEADIICDGFKNSFEMYGLIYDKFIADGDSNVYKKVLDMNPYKDLIVKKIECKNHILRNYSRKLRDICKDTSLGPIVLRRHIEKNQLRLRWAISKAIEFRKMQDVPLSEKIILLKKDIDNSVSHVFGEHKHCVEIGYFCNEKYQPQETVLADLKTCELYEKLTSHKITVMRHASSLIHDVNSNIVESFNNVIAKFVGGKRVHYCRGRSYQSRCSAAVLSFNTKTPIYVTKKTLSDGNSPSRFGKTIEFRKRKRSAIKRQLFSTNKTMERKGSTSESYGNSCQRPDISEEQFLSEQQIFLNSLHKSKEDIQILQEETVDQHQSDLWRIERKKRLTASYFADVCKRRSTTPCKSLVERILYPTLFFSKATNWGIVNEGVARSDMERMLQKKIAPCGLFVDYDLPYLAASPDGLIDESGIIEIKCPWTAKDITPEEGIRNKLIRFWKNGSVDRKHKWHYQIQGQLHITQKQYCILGVWTPHGTKLEVIMRDDDFWHKEMQNKLMQFYMQCILPEIIDPRKTRSMAIREPQCRTDVRK